jgi:hypothetical protein
LRYFMSRFLRFFPRWNSGWGFVVLLEFLRGFWKKGEFGVVF